jgi:hypothetical protein
MLFPVLVDTATVTNVEVPGPNDTGADPVPETSPPVVKICAPS